MVESKAVSVRLPLDLLEQLSSYANDNDLIRAGEPNIGGAIIAILREYLGDSDNPAGPPVRRDLVDALIKSAITQVESKLGAQISDLSDKVSSLSVNTVIAKGEQALTEHLMTELKWVKQDVEKLKTEATAKKSYHLIKDVA
jgi:hypothetical protein